MTQVPNPSIRFQLFRNQCEFGCEWGNLISSHATVEAARAAAIVYHTSPWPWTEDEIYDTWTGETPPVIPNDSQSKEQETNKQPAA